MSSFDPNKMEEYNRLYDKPVASQVKEFIKFLEDNVTKDKGVRISKSNFNLIAMDDRKEHPAVTAMLRSFHMQYGLSYLDTVIKDKGWEVFTDSSDFLIQQLEGSRHAFFYADPLNNKTYVRFTVKK